MNSKTWTVFAVVMILGLAAAACGSTSTSTPLIAPESAEETPKTPPTPTTAPEAAPSTFSIAVGIDPDNLDPAGTTTTTIANMNDYMVQTLVTIDQEGELQPLLAESWEISADGLEYTFNLVQGATFHDGNPFDAEAVKFSLDRMLDENVRVPQRSWYAAIKEVQVVDTYTVKLVLNNPSSPLLNTLSWTVAAIISPASVDQSGNTYENYQNPVGTGPYAFKERVKGERLVLTKYDEYWGEKPYYDEVVFRIVPEAATRESLLLAGQVEMIILPPIQDIPALQENPDIEVLLAAGDRTIFVAINNLRLPDARVRQALNYAVNKREIIDSVLFGAADIMDGPMASNLFGYCKTGPYEYDVEKAKALLAEAGFESGTELKFIAPTGRYLQDFQAAQAVSGFLAEVGIIAPVETMDWPSYIASITAPPDENEIDLHVLGWGPPYLDAAMQMLILNSINHPPDGLTSSFYLNERVDELIVAAEREFDPDKREAYYCEANQLIWEDAPWIFLWVQRFPIAYRADVEGVSFLPNEKFLTVYARPAQ